MSKTQLNNMTICCTNLSCGDPIATPINLGTSIPRKRRNLEFMYSSFLGFYATFQCPVCGENAIFKKVILGKGYALYKRIKGQIVEVTPPALPDLQSLVQSEVLSFLKKLQAKNSKHKTNQRINQHLGPN